MHTLTTFGDGASVKTAKDIIEGTSYRFPDASPPFKSIVDLGAHVGEFAIMAATYWPHATVHAFEPAPQVTPVLRENCRSYPNIVIHEQGFSPTPGRGQFFVNSMSTVASRSITPDYQLPGLTWTTIEADYVDAKTIMDLKPEVVKIDIEGPEVDFIKAALSELEQVTLIYVEFHSEDRRVDIDRLLLRTHALVSGHISEAMRGDLLYVRRERPLFPKT